MPRQPEPETRKNRKPLIVAATERLLREHGLSGVTTRAIAEAVPCSEGAIYVHFSGRTELLLAVLEQSLPEMLVPLDALEKNIGRLTPERNLTTAAEGLERFHQRVGPMLASLFAEPGLLNSFRESLDSRARGPRGAIARVAHYIRKEQALGRIGEQVDPELIASTMMASSFFRTFSAALTGQAIPALNPRSLVKNLLRSS
jgi:AcrR family transcriptional regulator